MLNTGICIKILTPLQIEVPLNFFFFTQVELVSTVHALKSSLSRNIQVLHKLIFLDICWTYRSYNKHYFKVDPVDDVNVWV